MKNIHILPTDKPSKLSYFQGRLLFDKEEFHKTFISQNIYITNSEEIKDKCYVLCSNSIGALYLDGVINTASMLAEGEWKKVILTTDQDLIKDGVQAIDDEFLEFIVKNPSCEFVEVKCYSKFNDGDFSDYKIFEDKLKHINKIIIPKEEPKQGIDISKGTIGIDPYNKQETLEEAAKRIFNIPEEKKGDVYFGSNIAHLRKGFNFGAKWQMERSYSEEEVLSMLLIKHDGLTPEYVLQQFKKK